MSAMSSTGAADAWSYRAGPWFAAFGPRVTVLLPESQRDQVIGVWSLVDGGAAFDEVLDALLASGLSRLPGFVLVSTDDGPTRVLLRGAGVSATLTTDAEDVTIDGSASGTWVERSVEGVTALSVVLAEADPADERAGTDFGIVTGLVRVARIDRPPYVEPVAVEEQPAEAEPAMADEAGDDVAPAAEEPAAEAMAEEPVAEPAAEEPAVEAMAEEPSPLDEPSPFDESAPLGGPMAPEETGLELSTGGDPLTDPMPSAPAPSGWVTPWDTPPPPAEPPSAEPPSAESPEPPTTEPPMTEELTADDWITAADAAPPTDQPAEPPAPMSGEPVTEFAPPTGPPPYAPPPPAYDAPAVDLPPPPLPVGSWEPIGGSQPPPPAAPDSGAMATPPVPDEPAGAGVAKLMISDGQQVLVDRVILIGRAPEARRFTDTEQPHLVAVPSRLHEISSTHIEVRPGTGADQGTAVVTDMGSTNGTVLVQPGLGPEDLKPGIAVQLVPGAIINLGDGVTIQVTRP